MTRWVRRTKKEKQEASSWQDFKEQKEKGIFPRLRKTNLKLSALFLYKAQRLQAYSGSDLVILKSVKDMRWRVWPLKLNKI